MEEMINFKGHTVDPAKVEEQLYKNKHIFQAAVIGVKDENGEDTIKAYISLKDESRGKITSEDLLKWAKENIPENEYPRQIVILDEVPTGTTGKVLRRQLKEREQK
ncbi:MAG: hypothetical protein ACFFDN_34390 [Candidatus Hodarchaeota archaeon]